MATAQPRDFPFSPVERLDPEPLFDRLLADEPLSRVRLPFGEPSWMATRREDVRTVLADRRFSRAAGAGRDEPRVRPNTGVPGNIMGVDPPEHSRLRRVISRAFTARRVEQLRPRATEIAHGLVDQMVARGGPADFVEAFALPLPTTVICELLGVPVQDRERFRTWTDAVMSTTRYTGQQVRDYHAELERYIAGLVAARRREPSGDLIGTLVAVRDNEDRLSESELVSLVLTVLVAGHETTATQIGNFLYVLLTRLALAGRLRADDSLVPRAVEELLRFVPLGYGGSLPRYATEDVELSGVTVRAGEPIVPNMIAANRDPAAYPDPDTIDLDRDDPGHLAFGHGQHLCVGAGLARMELQVAVRVLLERLPRLRLADDSAGGGPGVTWKSGVSVRGPETLPVEWE